MKNKFSKSLLLLIFFIYMTLPVFSQYGLPENDKAAVETTREEPVHKNHAALFLGLSSNPDKSETVFSLGADWEYKISGVSPGLGIGLIAELGFAKKTEIVLAVPFFIHPYKQLKLWLAPGWMKSDTSETKSSGIIDENNVDNKPNHFLFRAGAGYDIEVGKLTMTPGLSADFVDDSVIWVFGISFGMGF